MILVELLLVLASGLALLAALDTGAVIELTLTNLGQNTGLSAAALKTLQSVLQRLTITDMNFGHLYFPPSEMRGFILRT